MKTITVVATFQAKQGKEEELKNIFTSVLAPTRAEAGCINYDLHQSPDDPAKFLFHENWASLAALDAHLKAPHIAPLLARMDEFCAVPPEIKIWEKIG